jgi:hypothetical protein
VPPVIREEKSNIVELAYNITELHLPAMPSSAVFCLSNPAIRLRIPALPVTHVKLCSAREADGFALCSA